MILNKYFSSLCLLSVACFVSAIYLILQTYDSRVSFSEIEKLNKEEENLSLQLNLLISEVEHFRNQLTIRKIATEKLGMTSPTKEQQVFVYMERSEL